MMIKHKTGCSWSSLPMDGPATCECGALNAAAWNRRAYEPAPAGDALAELAAKLIAWAGDGEKTLSHDEYNAWCVFCGVPRQFNPKPHKVNCLHKRAQALQGKKNDVGDNQ